jgi:hypothetical protein
MTESERRKDAPISSYFDEPFARFRGADAPEDVAANAKATESGDADS